MKNIIDFNKSIEENYLHKKCKTLIVFDDVIADMLGNKKLTPVVTDLFIKGRKTNFALVFHT